MKFIARFLSWLGFGQPTHQPKSFVPTQGEVLQTLRQAKKFKRR
jgi:hypothetical protein